MIIPSFSLKYSTPLDWQLTVSPLQVKHTERKLPEQIVVAYAQPYQLEYPSSKLIAPMKLSVPEVAQAEIHIDNRASIQPTNLQLIRPPS